jgi:hypothetical protein
MIVKIFSTTLNKIIFLSLRHDTTTKLYQSNKNGQSIVLP